VRVRSFVAGACSCFEEAVDIPQCFTEYHEPDVCCGSQGPEYEIRCEKFLRFEFWRKSHPGMKSGCV
jgi:hypothetical protein